MSLITGSHEVFTVQGKAAGQGYSAPIHVRDGAWLGASSTVVAGTTVGECSIVAAGALVNRDTPPGAVVGGVPARVLTATAGPAHEIRAATCPKGGTGVGRGGVLMPIPANWSATAGSHRQSLARFAMHEVWFWQRIVTPHMAGLANALATHGCSVHYVAEEAMSAGRADLGWDVPELGSATLHFCSKDGEAARLVSDASQSSVHICQGLRANGYVSEVQQLLAKRDMQQWVVMETVDDRGWRGVLKRLEYSRLFRSKRNVIQGVLASGYTTSDWVIRRGMSSARVYPFAYFLTDMTPPEGDEIRSNGLVRFIFVGQFIKRKRLELLLQALATLEHCSPFELIVVGSGPLEQSLRSMSEATLPGRVRWIGRVQNREIPELVAQADCLVLPSNHDGWGAVVSEALMVGTPVICSDSCGAAEVAKRSGFGQVFARDDLNGLRQSLRAAIDVGPVRFNQRAELAAWARCLNATAGARYLIDIIAGTTGATPPWHRAC